MILSPRFIREPSRSGEEELPGHVNYCLNLAEISCHGAVGSTSNCCHQPVYSLPRRGCHLDASLPNRKIPKTQSRD